MRLIGQNGEPTRRYSMDVEQMARRIIAAASSLQGHTCPGQIRGNWTKVTAQLHASSATDIGQEPRQTEDLLTRYR
jgi:hypothetical protein